MKLGKTLKQICSYLDDLDNAPRLFKFCELSESSQEYVEKTFNSQFKEFLAYYGKWNISQAEVKLILKLFDRKVFNEHGTRTSAFRVGHNVFYVES